MPHRPPDRIRNVALVGHRGSGKTSLAEAILFESGVVNRLGKVDEGTTVCDFEDDEQERGMSIGAAVTSFEHDGRKVNMIDTPGESSFIGKAASARRTAVAGEPRSTSTSARLASARDSLRCAACHCRFVQ